MVVCGQDDDDDDDEGQDVPDENAPRYSIQQMRAVDVDGGAT